MGININKLMKKNIKVNWDSLLDLLIIYATFVHQNLKNYESQNI